MSGDGPGPVRFIDCNARIGRWSNPQPEQFTTPDGLLGAWERLSIDGGLVYHALAWEWSPARGNERLLAAIEGDDRLRPCLVALPPTTREIDPPREFAARVRELHGAVRIFPGKHSWRVSGWCAGALFDALAAERVPVLVDVGELDWDALAGMLRGWPSMPVILLNFYYRNDRLIYPLLEQCPNLYLESNTYGVFRGVETLCERFGAGRLVFGTRLPELEAGGPMALVTYAEIPDDDRRMIAGGNLLRLLGEEE